MASSNNSSDLVEVHHGGDYSSEFEYDSEAEKQRNKRKDLTVKHKEKSHKVAPRSECEAEYSKDEGRRQRFHILSMDAYSRHKKFINDYMIYYGGKWSEFKQNKSVGKTDLDVIRENHRFLWTEEDNPDDSWEKRMSKRYYDKLFKEYCISDLSRYKENKVAMRWRIEKEVVEGKGQFICGNKKCTEKEGLRSWEVNFAYVEHGERKNALVKLRLCPDCSYKLNYHHKKRELTQTKSFERPSKIQRTEDGHNTSTKGSGVQETNANTSDKPSSLKPEESDSSLWTGPQKINEEKSRDEEYDEYFEDMFL